MNPIKLSYIIITWNGLNYLRNLLTSMQHQLARQDIEVILVDNCSTDGTIPFIQNTYPSIHLIQLSENKGVAYARNRAMEIARGEYLLILDNDIQITDEAIEGMTQYMDTHLDVGVCGCKLLYPDGFIQESCKPYPGIGQKIKGFICSQHDSIQSFTYQQEIEKGEPFEPVYLIGACQMVRRSIYQFVGALDERIFYGPEDCDYCLRIRLAGGRVMYLPMVYMYHHCQRRTHSKPFSKMGRRHLKALLYFYKKYRKI